MRQRFDEKRIQTRERAADLLRKADDELSSSPMPQTSAQKKGPQKSCKLKPGYIATPPTPFIKDLPRVSLGHLNFSRNSNFPLYCERV
jgi:hypothetical protein